MAYTNGGGEKRLRKLERTLLEAGVTVTRTADDLPRYHGKMTIVDDTLFVLGFNYTRLDIERSRSFGLVTRDKKLVHDAARSSRPIRRGSRSRPATAASSSARRTRESACRSSSARPERQLLIYDERITDKLMLRLLRERVAAGVEIRVIGKIDKKIDGVCTCSLPDLRLHVRAIVRDGTSVFVGSQSLRKPELDARREIGHHRQRSHAWPSGLRASSKRTGSSRARTTPSQPSDEEDRRRATESAQAAGA